MGDKVRNHVKIVLSILTFLISILLIVLLFLFVLYVFLKYYSTSEPSSYLENETEVYRTYSLNTITEETSTGLVELFSHDKESIFYVVGDGSYNLLSKFDTDEYKCTGSCFCETATEKRSTSQLLLVRSLIYLVASMTSIIAYKKAEEYFHKECERHENLCPSPSSIITSKIEECEPIRKKEEDKVQESSSSSTSSNEKKISEPIEEEKGKIYTKDFRYLCTGRCLPIPAKYFNLVADEIGSGKSKEHVKSLKRMMKKFQKNANCKKIGLTKTVSSEELNDFYDYLKKSPGKDVDETKFIEDVDRFTLIFFSMLMDELCIKKGVPLDFPGLKEDGKGPTFCEAWKGSMADALFKPELNPTMKCVRG